MASSKKSSTSKTARVMNLLSKSREEVPVEQPIASTAIAPETAPAPVQSVPATETTATPAPAPAPVPAPTAHTPHTTPLISSMQTDSAISNQVLSALENALEDELKTSQLDAPTAPVESVVEAAPAAPVESVVEAVPAVPAVSVSEAVPAAPAESVAEATPAAPAESVPEVAPVTSAEQNPAPTPIAEVAAEVPIAAPAQPAPASNEPVSPPPVATPVSGEADKDPAPPTQFKVDSNTTYVNVMETLVEEKANKYIDMFGLCKCHRCVADVKAYALNHLSPKYVVMRTGEVIPRITLYENQFSAVVTAQILNACKIVMASPRHDQP